MIEGAACVLGLLVACAAALPVSQPVYQNQQYIPAQSLASQFLQELSSHQPEYLQQQRQVGPSLFEGARRAQPPQYQNPTAIQQVLLPTNVDRQVQRVANQVAGPQYAQQIQFAQQQAQAQQAIATAQRKATSQTYAGRPIQPVPIPQPQYLRELPQAQPQARPYARPAGPSLQNYRPQQQQQQQPQEQDDYDPNPSYQFGFDVKDDLYTNYQNRNEQRQGDKISGSYSVVDSDGFIRTVKYTADPKEGFKAEVTRQPTDIVVKIPKPLQPQQFVEAVPGRSAQGQKQNVIYQYQ